MKAIGGYYELELQNYKTVFHDKAVPVNSGRNALEYIFRANDTFKKIFIPLYSCDTILQPIKRMNLEYDFYPLNRDFTPKLKKLNKNEALIFINYFGIANTKVERIIEEFNNVIIDNSQAFFQKPVKNISTFYSPRKFFGLPDGGFVYTKENISINLKLDKSSSRFTHLLKRLEDGAEAGFNDFQENEKNFNRLPLRKMSLITERLLGNINFKRALKMRNNNFMLLHKQLKKLNELSPIIDREKINGPMAYPFLKKGNKKLKEIFIKNKIFIPTYWNNVYELTTKKCWEYYLTDNLIVLPIYQNINPDEIIFMVNLISKHKEYN